MKNKHACIAASLILALLFCTVVLNRVYVNNTFNTLFDRLDSITEINELFELRDYWEERRKVLNFSLSEPELDKISSIFDEMIISAEAEDYEEYKKSAARLKRAAEVIRDLEDLTFDNIF
ncbi:MAG: DUF4363 family protein [Eubacteriales bacterium]